MDCTEFPAMDCFHRPSLNAELKKAMAKRKSHQFSSLVKLVVSSYSLSKLYVISFMPWGEFSASLPSVGMAVYSVPVPRS